MDPLFTIGSFFAKKTFRWLGTEINKDEFVEAFKKKARRNFWFGLLFSAIALGCGYYCHLHDIVPFSLINDVSSSTPKGIVIGDGLWNPAFITCVLTSLIGIFLLINSIVFKYKSIRIKNMSHSKFKKHMKKLH